MDGGSDTESNFVALCSACHAEWHALEHTLKITHETRIGLPPAATFVAAFLPEIQARHACGVSPLHRKTPETTSRFWGEWA